MRSMLMVLAAAAVVTATAGAGSLNGGGDIAIAAELPLGQQVEGGGTPPSSGTTHRYYSGFWRAQPGVLSSKAAAQADFDFNGDGFSDNAVGVPFEDVGKGPVADGGAVQILYGSAGGFTGVNQFVTENTPGIVGPAEQGDQFGWASSIGDFNGDGFADLAMGVPGKTVGEAVGAGAVDVMYGSGDGLFGADQAFTEGMSA